MDPYQLWGAHKWQLLANRMRVDHQLQLQEPTHIPTQSRQRHQTRARLQSLNHQQAQPARRYGVIR